MKEYAKAERLSGVSYEVRGRVAEEAERLRAEGKDIIMLNTGNPPVFGLNPPAEIVSLLAERITAAGGYSLTKGLTDARRAIAGYCKTKDIPGVAEDDVFTGNGASEMIMIAMQALLNDGDEILVPSPDYPLWTAAVRLAGARAVHYVCDEQAGWYPDVSDMRKKITARTKGIVVINPNNPTGVLYPRELLTQITELAGKYGLLLFSDEIYDRLVMDGLEHVSTAALASDLPVVTLNGLSKSHMMPGFRCGWMTVSGDKSAIRDYVAGINMLASMRLCSNVPAQTLIPFALSRPAPIREYLAPGGRLYEQREIITTALNSISGVSVVKPQAAFYVFPRLDLKKYHISDDEQFALDLLKREQIMVVHGRGFNWGAPDHFRVVYLPAPDELREVASRLARFLDGYGQ